MSSLEDFNEITRRNHPLANLTWMKVGGAADYLIEPRSQEELAQIVACCDANGIPLHILGDGSNLLIRDEGVRGAVIRIIDEPFSDVSITDTQVTAGAGVRLSHLISQTIKEGLAGLEILAGIPGTLGGALHGNSGGKSGDVGQFVESVTVMSSSGETQTRSRDDLSFGYRSGGIDDAVILAGQLQLRKDEADQITRRMRKLWIMKKATQPLTFQSAGCIFKNPRGTSAGALIEQAGLKGKRVGGAEISDRHGNFIITHEKVTSDDVLQLIDLVRTQVADRFGVDLELEIEIW